MFCASIIYYLILRKATINKINYRFSNIANFSIPSILFLILNLIQHNNLFPPLPLMGAMLLNAFFLSYIGAVVSYIAIQKAPNAGYSLIIQKSYAVFTSIAAVFLFNSTLSPIKFIAILITLASTAFVSISRGKKVNRANYSWVVLSFIAFFLFGALRLTNKAIINGGVPSTVLLFWSQLFVALFSIIDYLIHRKTAIFQATKDNLLTLLGVGVSVTFFYYFLLTSEVHAPNLGYVNVINSSSNAVYTVLVAWLFKDKLTKMKLIAVVTAILGLILLII